MVVYTLINVRVFKGVKFSPISNFPSPSLQKFYISDTTGLNFLQLCGHLRPNKFSLLLLTLCRHLLVLSQKNTLQKDVSTHHSKTSEMSPSNWPSTLENMPTIGTLPRCTLSLRIQTNLCVKICIIIAMRILSLNSTIGPHNKLQ